MGAEASALQAGDRLLEELRGPAPGVTKAPTMGNLKRCSYTHDALIDLIIEHPEYTQNQLAAHFGYTPGWISNILASDAFQIKLAARREQIVDPELKATIEERFRALAIQSLKVLQEKLSLPASQVSDNVALRAAELGAKALGIGGHAAPPQRPDPTDRLTRLAERLVGLQANVRERVINGEVAVLETKPLPNAAETSGIRVLQGPEPSGGQPPADAGRNQADGG